MGGSTGTTTTTQNNIPWNSGNLSQIQNQATSMLGTNPLNYYPGTTYAMPTPYQNASLDMSGLMGINSALAMMGFLPQAQQNAMYNNNFIGTGGVMDATSPWTNALSNIGMTNPVSSAQAQLDPIANGSYYQAANPWIQSLMGLGATNAGQPGMDMLNPIASGQYFQGSQPYISGLQSLAYGGPAADQLAATASGQYLGSNPYLDATFKAASDPVTNAFMTATAPQTDSAMAAAGRFGSGGLATMRNINQQALGDTLSNLSAGIYEPAYAQERNLQVNAANQLGGLQTNALTNALSGYNQGVGLMSNAGSSLGQLGISGNLAQQQAYNEGLQQYYNQVNQIMNAANASGQLGVQGANAQTSALNDVLGQYINMVTQQQNSINQTPNLTNMAFGDLNSALTAGQQQQALMQQQLTDQANRYYGSSYAPWQTLNQAGSLVGGAIPGLSMGQSPYYSNPLAQGLGMGISGLGALGSLGSGLGSASAGTGLMGLMASGK